MRFLPILLAAGIDVTPWFALIPPEARGYLIAAAVSALAATLNEALRRQKRKGKRSGPVKLLLLSFLNLFAGNLDQTMRQAKAAKEPKE